MRHDEPSLRVDIVPTQRRRGKYMELLSSVFSHTAPGHVATTADLYALASLLMRRLKGASLSDVQSVLTALLLGKECSEDTLRRVSGFLAAQHQALAAREYVVPQDFFTGEDWVLARILGAEIQARSEHRCLLDLDIYTGPQAGRVETVSVSLRRYRRLAGDLGYYNVRREPGVNPVALSGCYAFALLESEFSPERDEISVRCLDWCANNSIRKKNRELRESRSRTSRRTGKAEPCLLGSELVPCTECGVSFAECPRAVFREAPAQVTCGLCGAECWVRNARTSRHICVSCLGRLVGAVRVE